MQVSNPAEYVWYAALGVAAGVVAIAIPVIFYGLRDAFLRLPVPRALKPAIGGLGVGLVALLLPQVLGGGYQWIQQAIDGHLELGLLALLIIGKTIAFAFTISSGGSGGVFAPTLYVGAMLGAFLAKVFGQPSAPFAVIGMAAVFAGAARVPVASLLMVTEMTAGYHLLAPASLAVSASYFLQRTFSSRTYPSLYEAQVATPMDSPVHHEHVLRGAFHLLSIKGVQLPTDMEHLRLTPLLLAGIPLELPDGKLLRLGVLSPRSAWVGRRLGDGEIAAEAPEIVAILRGPHLQLPDPDLTLEPQDRVLFLTSPKEWDRIRHRLEPVPTAKRRRRKTTPDRGAKPAGGD